MKNYVFVLAIFLFAACSGGDKKSAPTSKNEPITQTKNSDEFNNSFGALLNNYYSLKDALVLTNDTMANRSAMQLSSSAEAFPVSSLGGDSSIVQMAQANMQTISAEAKGLIGEKNIEDKRKSFQMISDNMYDLVRTVRYDRETVYHQYCPMAFNDAGAYWLSKTSDIKNPYFGKKMLTCGEVKDSLSFQ